MIIGAGRGRRLAHLTQDVPKPLVSILGRPMLEGILDALQAGGFDRGQTVFICGYKGEVIRAAYPDLTYVPNHDWASNNILLSLLCAREHMSDGFVSTYADIVYEPEAVVQLMQSPHDITVVCDTDWRRRYQDRSEHPESDAEKMVAEGDRVTRISRNVPAAEATGEFIGVMRLSPTGVESFLSAFDAARAELGEEGALNEGRGLGKAYLVDLLQRMIEQGSDVHCSFVSGGYMEIDTTEDAACAERWWRGR
ncbi:MAG: phosphocholine cytidylyltransferase family protein [Deltaproteobacteria bacterium]|nr:phosphocholine cytidylyltransferase family protein [Deltaproteobacteria bacterium]MBW2536411.1 phosphocholine cytidylyltransferase family protein [Deltaproteobacteria bacterium]